jgi:hypothetical protein
MTPFAADYTSIIASYSLIDSDSKFKAIIVPVVQYPMSGCTLRHCLLSAVPPNSLYLFHVASSGLEACSPAVAHT